MANGRELSTVRQSRGGNKGLACPRCGSRVTYVRISSQEFVCRQCGLIKPIDDIFKKK